MTTRARIATRQRLALVVVEGRRLARHPLILVGTGLAVLSLIRIWSESARSLASSAAAAALSLMLGSAALVSLNQAGLRDRDGTAELYASLPAPDSARRSARALAIACPFGIALMLGSAAFVTGTVAGHVARPLTRLAFVAQGPLAVAALGAVGLLLARWIPSRYAGPVAVVALLLSPIAWFFPWVLNQSWSTAGMAGWQLVHLAGVAVFAAAVGSMSREAGIRGIVAATVGLCAAIGGLVLVVAGNPA